MILTLHILSVISAFCVVAYADHYGFKWVRGSTPTLDEKKLKNLHLLTWGVLLLVILTGGTLFYNDYESLLTSSVFLLKMSFVGALIVNALVIGFLMKVATNSKFVNLSTKEKIPLIIIGGTSSLCWLGALTCAFYIY
jgi:hypothetical protein